MTARQARTTKDFPKLPELKGMITITLVAEMLGVSRQAAHRMALTREFKAWRVPSAGTESPVVARLAEIEKLKEKRAGVVTVEVPA